jgi:hypothetical protein
MMLGMTVFELLMASSAVCMLLGSFIYRAAATSEGQRRRGVVYGLWLTAGLLGVSTVVASVIRCATGGMVGYAAGEIVAGIFFGALFSAVSVCLLGLTGFWAVVRRHF